MSTAFPDALARLADEKARLDRHERILKTLERMLGSEAILVSSVEIEEEPALNAFGDYLGHRRLTVRISSLPCGREREPEGWLTSDRT